MHERYSRFLQVKNVPNCLIHMGDRPIKITLQRALKSLSWWQTMRLAWYFLKTEKPITLEDVEHCKSRDSLEDSLAELTKAFPTLSQVLVKERDTYLTYSLQLASLPQATPNGMVPARVVGVVGMGHMPGIIQNWGKVKTSDIPPILR